MKPSRQALTTEDDPLFPALTKACPVCFAIVGDGCRDPDGNLTATNIGPMFHVWRRDGVKWRPPRVQHTGEYNAEGGAMLQELPPDPKD